MRRDLMDGAGAREIDLDGSARRSGAIIAEIEAELAVGSRDGEEVRDIARIETLRLEIDEAFADIREAERLFAAGEDAAARVFLGTSLATPIDGRIKRMIEAAPTDQHGPRPRVPPLRVLKSLQRH